MSIIKKFRQKIDFLISPPTCFSCKIFLEQREIFCKNCYSKISPIVSLNVEINSKYSMNVYAVSSYEEPLKSLILSKLSSSFLGTKNMAEIIWQYTNLKNLEPDFFVPIPLHWTRFLKRGFNQSHEMCKVLASLSNKQVADILVRNKMTKFQSSLSPKGRVLNVKDAFSLVKDGKDYSDKSFMIVDDLYTSGSTLIAAAKQLATLNPKSINAVVLCRVI